MSLKKLKQYTTLPTKGPGSGKPLLTCPSEKRNQNVSRNQSNSVQPKGADATAANKTFSSLSFYDPYFDEDMNSDFDADPLSESESEDDDKSPKMEMQSVSDHEEEQTMIASGSAHFDETSDAANDEVSSCNSDVECRRSQDLSSSLEYSSTEEDVDVEVVSSDSDEDFTIPLPSSDAGDSLSQNIDIFNDVDDKEYTSLRNSEISSGKLISFHISDFNDSIKCADHNNVELKCAFPGVYAGAYHKFKDVSVGFLKISPKTIKPFERATNVSIVYTLMRGQVILKSCAFEVVGNKKILQKKVIEEGTSLTIPMGHPYTLENRSNCDALLQYVVIL